jgi:hypothetical protein
MERKEEEKYQLTLGYLKECKCAQEGCFNYHREGYIYCIGHLYGFPQRMLEEDIKRLKEAGVK